MKNVDNYTILAVDDAKDSLMLIEFDLIDAGYQVMTAESGHSALKVLEDNEVNLILLDMYMPGLSGLETLQQIKSLPHLVHIPIIMLSASDDGEKIVSALELGADDYVTKPYIPKVLLARMRNSIRLMEKTIQLEILAKTDFLTKVNNRGSFEELASKTISQAKRTEQTVSLAMFDLDFFKQVNDNYGHEAGDKALIDFAKILLETFRDYDIIGRIGGEEFAVCMPNTSIDDAYNACERSRKSLESHLVSIEYQGSSHQLSLTVSIGITSDSGQSMLVDELLRVADHALYQAKENGRNQSIIENIVQDELKDEPFVMTDNQTDSKTDDKPANSQTFPGIDFSIGVNNVLGDEELFADILVMFHQDHGQYHALIQEAISSNNQKQLKHLVHTLKGVSCSIGAMKLFELCKVLDITVNEQSSNDYQALFEPVKDELIKVIKGIEAQLAEKL